MRKNILALLDLPAQNKFFLALRGLVDLVPEALGLAGNLPEYPLGKIRGGDAQKHEKANYHANAGHKLYGRHTGSPPYFLSLIHI